VPTRAGWTTLVGGVIALAGARAFALLELYLLGTAALAALVLAVLWTRSAGPHLEVQRRFLPDVPTAGSPARVEVSVRNLGRRRQGSLVVHDPVAGTVGAHLPLATVGPGATATTGYRLPTRSRGPVAVGPLRVERVDPLGLARTTVVTAPELAVTVLPRPVSSAAGELGEGGRHPAPESSGAMAMTSGVAELDILRPYQVGDDLRRVHWRASAHADDLLVRRDEQAHRGLLVVLLDARRDAMAPEPFEWAVSAAAGLVHAAAEAGHRVRLAISDGTDTGPVDAQRHRRALLERLAHVTQHDGRADLPAPDRTEADRAVLVTGGEGTDLPVPTDGSQTWVLRSPEGAAR
jgi:uncharacterized protein (DUF58 family)